MLRPTLVWKTSSTENHDHESTYTRMAHGVQGIRKQGSDVGKGVGGEDDKGGKGFDKGRTSLYVVKGVAPAVESREEGRGGECCGSELTRSLQQPKNIQRAWVGTYSYGRCTYIQRTSYVPTTVHQSMYEASRGSTNQKRQPASSSLPSLPIPT